MRGRDVVKIAEVIREGVGRLKAIGANVILIDPQFAPRVIEKPDTEQMVALIAATAKRQNVDLFRRFAVMRYWREVTHDGKSAKRIATSLGVGCGDAPCPNLQSTANPDWMRCKRIPQRPSCALAS